jgi:hypothetical protein
MPGGLTVPDFDFYTRTLGRSRLLPSQRLSELPERQPVIWLVTHLSTRHPIDPTHQAHAFSVLASAYIRAEHISWKVDAFESLQAWRFSLPQAGIPTDNSRRRMATSGPPRRPSVTHGN